MADKKLSSVSAVSDMNYVYAETSSGETVKISKSDLASVVAGIFPPIKMVLGGTIQVQNYTRPVSLGIFSRNLAGDEVRTLTICKTGINFRYIDVNIILVPVSGNFWEGHAKFCGGKASGPFSYTSNLNGKIENIRTVSYKGDDYIAVDFIIRQFGSCAVYITGMHPDITEMIDVTGEI